MRRFSIGLFAFITLFGPGAIRAEEAERELVQLYQYKPMYFLLGTPQTKAQFSLKARVVRGWDLYFAYSQLIVWDLFKESRPFRDLNYNPEGFYRWSIGGRPADLPPEDRARISNRWIDLGFYEHESNGKAGDASRSWDRHSVRYHETRKVGERASISWSFKLWYARNYDPGMRDFQRYRGAYEVEVTLADFLGPYFERNDLTLRFYPGGKSTVNPLEGGRELTLRLKGKHRSFLASTVFQFFQGRGENMLDYRQNVVGFRAGLGL